MTDYGSFPRPVSDPEAEGLPGTADDDSTADAEVNSPRISDGLDPAILPTDEPLAVDEYGITPAEAQHREPLAAKLVREEPDFAAAVAPAVEDAIGRLVQPDEGAHEDVDSAEVAYDAGAAGGGPSAEEAAMHLETHDEPPS